MAKKDLDDEAVEPDDEFDTPDIDDLDFDFDDDEENSRSPYERTAGGFLRGARDAGLSRGVRRQMIEGALPRGYGQAYRELEQAWDTGKELYDVAAEKIKPVSKQMRKLGAKASTRLEGYLPESVSRKLQEWTSDEDERDKRILEKTDQDKLEIQQAIQDTFGQQQAGRAEEQRTEFTQRATEQAIEETRHQSQSALLRSIAESVKRQVDFQDRITASYQRKQIELQYRQLFYLRDSYTHFQAHTNEVVRQLKSIAHNTALPDANKYKGTEYLREMLEDYAIESLADYSSNFMSKVRDRLKSKVSELGSQFAEGVGFVSDAAEQAEEMGEFVDPYEQAGEMAGSQAASTGLPFLARRFGEQVGKVPGVRRVGESLDYYSREYPFLLRDYVQEAAAGRTSEAREERAEQEEDDSREGWRGEVDRIRGLSRRGLGKLESSLADFIVDLMPRFQADQSYQRDEIAETDQAIPFTRRTERAITEVIPGYLSQILQETTRIRTGRDDIERRSYDYAQGEFVNQGELGRRLTRRILPEGERERTQRGAEEILQTLDPDEELDSESRQALVRQLLEDVRQGRTFDPSRFGQAENLDAVTDQDTAQRLSERMRWLMLDEQGRQGGDESSLRRRSRAARQFQDLRQRVPNYQNTIQQLQRVYSPEELRQTGLLAGTDKPGEQRLQGESILSYLSGESEKLGPQRPFESYASRYRREAERQVIGGERSAVDREIDADPDLAGMKGTLDALLEKFDTQTLADRLQSLIDQVSAQDPSSQLRQIVDLLTRIRDCVCPDRTIEEPYRPVGPASEPASGSVPAADSADPRQRGIYLRDHLRSAGERGRQWAQQARDYSTKQLNRAQQKVQGLGPSSESPGIRASSSEEDTPFRSRFQDAGQRAQRWGQQARDYAGERARRVRDYSSEQADRLGQRAQAFTPSWDASGAFSRLPEEDIQSRIPFSGIGERGRQWARQAREYSTEHLERIRQEAKGFVPSTKPALAFSGMGIGESPASDESQLRAPLSGSQTSSQLPGMVARRALGLKGGSETSAKTDQIEIPESELGQRRDGEERQEPRGLRTRYRQAQESLSQRVHQLTEQLSRLTARERGLGTVGISGAGRIERSLSPSTDDDSMPGYIRQLIDKITGHMDAKTKELTAHLDQTDTTGDESSEADVTSETGRGLRGILGYRGERLRKRDNLDSAALETGQIEIPESELGQRRDGEAYQDLGGQRDRYRDTWESLSERLYKLTEQLTRLTARREEPGAAGISGDGGMGEPPPSSTGGDSMPGYIRQLIDEITSHMDAKTNQITDRLDTLSVGRQDSPGILNRLGEGAGQAAQGVMSYYGKIFRGMGRLGLGAFTGGGKAASGAGSLVGRLLGGSGDQRQERGTFSRIKSIITGEKSEDRRRQSSDIYRIGHPEPVLQAREMEAGHYFDQQTGEPIRTFEDIQGPVIDRSGDVIITQDDIDNNRLYMPSGEPATESASFASKLASGVGSYLNYTTMPSRMAFDIGKKVLKMGAETLRGGPHDIYVVGEQRPRMLATVMENGGYLSRATGEPITSIDDIDGDVIDRQGNIVLSLEDMRQGIVDNRGNRLSSLTEMAKKSLMGIARGIGRYYKGVFNLAGRGIGAVGRGLGRMVGLSGTQGREEDTAAEQELPSTGIDSKTAQAIERIREHASGIDDKSSRQLESLSKIHEQLTQFSRYQRSQTESRFRPGEEGYRTGSWREQLSEEEEAQREQGRAQQEEGPEGSRWDQSDSLIPSASSIWDVISEKLGPFVKDTLGSILGLLGFKKLMDRIGSKGTGGVEGSGDRQRGKTDKSDKPSRSSKTAGKKSDGLLKKLGKWGGRAAKWGGRAALWGGRALLGVGSIFAGVFSTPVLIGVGVATTIAAAAYGSYKLYQHFSKDDLSPFDRFRLAQYGVTKDQDEAAAKILQLEEKLTGKVSFNKDSRELEVDGDSVDMESIVEIFEIGDSDQERQEKLKGWLESRFLPVLAIHTETAKAMADTEDPRKVYDKLKGSDRLKYLTKTHFDADSDASPYTYQDSPFATVQSLLGSKQVDNVYQKVRQEIEKKIDSSDPGEDAKAPEERQRGSQSDRNLGRGAMGQRRLPSSQRASTGSQRPMRLTADGQALDEDSGIAQPQPGSSKALGLISGIQYPIQRGIRQAGEPLTEAGQDLQTAANSLQDSEESTDVSRRRHQAQVTDLQQREANIQSAKELNRVTDILRRQYQIQRSMDNRLQQIGKSLERIEKTKYDEIVELKKEGKWGKIPTAASGTNGQGESDAQKKESGKSRNAPGLLTSGSQTRMPVDLRRN